MSILKGSRGFAVVSLTVLVVLGISLSWAIADASPPLEEWSRTLGGSEDDFGESVQETSDRGYIITGYTNSFGAGRYDVYLVKLVREQGGGGGGISGFPYLSIAFGLIIVLLYCDRSARA